MKRTFGIIILCCIIICFMGLVYWDISSELSGHGAESVFEQLMHYAIHIIICLMFCTIFHGRVHKLWNRLLHMIGIETHDDCHK